MIALLEVYGFLLPFVPISIIFVIWGYAGYRMHVESKMEQKNNSNKRLYFNSEELELINEGLEHIRKDFLQRRTLNNYFEYSIAGELIVKINREITRRRPKK